MVSVLRPGLAGGAPGRLAGAPFATLTFVETDGRVTGLETRDGGAPVSILRRVP